MKIHMFETSKAADDAASDARWGFEGCLDIAEDDLLVVEAEGIVGVASQHPFAVTKYRGEFSEFVIDWLLKDPRDLKKMVDAIRSAVAEAQRRGYELDPGFAVFA